VTMQNMIATLSATPGQITSLGGELGEHTHAILENELGLSTEEIAALEADGVISGATTPVA
jgi:formyl-CoA transferase